MTERRRAVYFGKPERRRQSLREHQEILDALVHRDEERAVRLLDAHMSGADSYWQDLVAGSPPAASGETVGSGVS
jgi:GntR family transcriptional repressor for pyruvate dehydrogenase complex